MATGHQNIYELNPYESIFCLEQLDDRDFKLTICRDYADNIYEWAMLDGLGQSRKHMPGLGENLSNLKGVTIAQLQFMAPR